MHRFGYDNESVISMVVLEIISIFCVCLPLIYLHIRDFEALTSIKHPMLDKFLFAIGKQVNDYLKSFYKYLTYDLCALCAVALFGYSLYCTG